MKKIPEFPTALELSVLELLQNNPKGLRRDQLQKKIFKSVGDPNNDRRIRMAISKLRKRNYVIASSSTEPGYRLTTDREAVRHFVAEQRKRARELNATASRVERAYGLRKQSRMNLSA